VLICRAANNLAIARFLVALDGWHTEALIATRDSAVRSCAVAAVVVCTENYSIRTYCHSYIFVRWRIESDVT